MGEREISQNIWSENIKQRHDVGSKKNWTGLGQDKTADIFEWGTNIQDSTNRENFFKSLTTFEGRPCTMELISFVKVRWRKPLLKQWRKAKRWWDCSHMISIQRQERFLQFARGNDHLLACYSTSGMQNQNPVYLKTRQGWFRTPVSGLILISEAQDRDQWRDLVNTVINLRVP
jgi:hypothetical protein